VTFSSLPTGKIFAVFLDTLASANRRVTNPHAWLLLLAAVTAVPAVPRPAAAAVIVQESFDYAAVTATRDSASRHRGSVSGAGGLGTG
jgi:hypothetical protein